MELKKTLGLFDALAIGIGAIVGAGIFVVTGIAAGLAGPALLLSLLISACISAFTALSFAELAEIIPKEGEGYEYRVCQLSCNIYPTAPEFNGCSGMYAERRNCGYAGQLSYFYPPELDPEFCSFNTIHIDAAMELIFCKNCDKM